MEKGYVYIVKDEFGRTYVGSTSDVQRRTRQHLSGHTQTTRNMKCPKIVFVQEYDSLMHARKVELRIKKLKRKDYVENMIRDGFIKLQ